MVLLAGRPDDSSFVQSLQSLKDNMDRAHPQVIPEAWTKKAKNGGRGNHTAVSVGLSLGGGSTVCPLSEKFHPMLTPVLQRPGWLKVSSKRTSEAVDSLVRHPAMSRLAGYVKGGL